MAQLDRKNRAFYDSLDDEEKKKFSLFVLNRWASCVGGDADLQYFYLVATNERFNKHFFALNKHPKLQWLCATTISPNMGTFRHNWISQKKKEPTPHKKTIASLYPTLKDDEVDLMAKLNTEKDVKAYLKKCGNDK